MAAWKGYPTWGDALHCIALLCRRVVQAFQPASEEEAAWKGYPTFAEDGSLERLPYICGRWQPGKATLHGGMHCIALLCRHVVQAFQPASEEEAAWKGYPTWRDALHCVVV